MKVISETTEEVQPLSSLTCKPLEGKDSWVGTVQHRIPPDALRRLSGVNGWRSSLHVFGEWLAIGAAIWLCSRYWNPLLYILTVIWIGARQHALVILLHEGTHYRLFRRRVANEIVSELFLAWPMFVTSRAYRTSHFAHHRFINTDDDPDWVRKKNEEWEFPKSWGGLVRILLRDVFGLNTHQFLAEVSDLAIAPRSDGTPSKAYTYSRITYYVCILGLLLYFGWFLGFLLYWIVPTATWFKMIFRIRGIAEHYGIDESDYGMSRTTLPSFLEWLFVAPKNVNYHLEHHLYPSVPFYRLPQLHKLLLDLPGYRQQAHITQTYWGVLRECCNRPALSSCVMPRQ